MTETVSTLTVANDVKQLKVRAVANKFTSMALAEKLLERVTQCICSMRLVCAVFCFSAAVAVAMP